MFVNFCLILCGFFATKKSMKKYVRDWNEAFLYFKLYKLRSLERYNF